VRTPFSGSDSLSSWIVLHLSYSGKGVDRKIYRGTTQKIPKNSKKRSKIALFSFFQGGGVKRPKNSKKDDK